MHAAVAARYPGEKIKACEPFFTRNDGVDLLKKMKEKYSIDTLLSCEPAEIEKRIAATIAPPAKDSCIYPDSYGDAIRSAGSRSY